MTVCKRIGAWLLTLVLLVSALPYTAFAASEDSHVVNATMEETSVEDIADNVTTQLLRGAKTKDETLSMEAKPTHEDSDSVEIIVVVDDSVAKPTAQAQVQSLLQKQEKAVISSHRFMQTGADGMFILVIPAVSFENSTTMTESITTEIVRLTGIH